MRRQREVKHSESAVTHHFYTISSFCEPKFFLEMPHVSEWILITAGRKCGTIKALIVPPSDRFLLVPAVTVVCAVSEDCVLPCSFHPGSNETIQWFRQGLGVYTFKRGDGSEDGRNNVHEQLSGRGSIYPPLVSHGNATLVIRRSGLKDRGTYRCHVSTSEGEQNAKVIVKVEGERQQFEAAT